jgi:hypothetical protein
LEGWIFMVGLRVFDVGALVVWLVWFFRLRDDDDDGEDFGRGHGDGSEPEEPCGPGGLRLPLPEAQPWHARRRDGHGDRHGQPATLRREAPHRSPTRVPAKRGPRN